MRKTAVHLNQSLESWRGLELLKAQFLDNCSALEQRHGALAERLRGFAPMGEYVLRREQAQLVVGRQRGGSVQAVVPAISPPAARAALGRIYPGRECNAPALVAGIDQGWLWQALHGLPCAADRPPLFFLCRQLEPLWLAMHLHDWRKMLGDERVFLFFGEDAVAQLQRMLVERPHLSPPTFALTLDAEVWGPGQTIGSLRSAVGMARSAARRRQAA